MEITQNSGLISHNASPESLSTVIDKISKRIRDTGDTPDATVEEQLDILVKLSEFDFGKYLLQNQGINGYWTHYMLTYPWLKDGAGKNQNGKPLSDIERFILEWSPSVLATQQRFKIFLREIQRSVTNGAHLGCVPCGLMGELLYLDFNRIHDITLTGIDYDKEALEGALALAEKHGLSKYVQLIQKNAWDMDFHETFELISSNGLNIYEPSHEKVIRLYKTFFDALKPGGKLVSSFLTYPSFFNHQSEWDISRINQDDLKLQKFIFVDIIDAKWQCYRSTEETRTQLMQAGFDDVRFFYDEAKIFPTFVAIKPVT